MYKQIRKNNKLIHVKAVPTGKMFVNGISSSYEETYSSDLEPVLSRDEHFDIMNRLNSTLAAYWPCGLVYFTGCILVPCTMGLSLLCPMMCISDAEKHATRLLENLSLKAKYFDRGVSFKLEKRCMTSHFVISFPFPEEESNFNILGKKVPDEEWGDSNLISAGSVNTNVGVDENSVQGGVVGIRVEPGGDRTRLKYT